VELLLICAVTTEGNVNDGSMLPAFHFVSHHLSSCCVLLAVQPKHTQYRFNMDPDAELVGFFVTASKGIWYTFGRPGTCV
jgi:hypothetical protein